MFFEKYFIADRPGSEVKKLSIQVVGCKGGKCLCGQYKEGPICRESTWQDPVGRIGKLKTPIQFAGHAPTNRVSKGDGSAVGSEYFIRDITSYHRSE